MTAPNWRTITHSLIVLRGLAYEHVDERYRNAVSELKAELLLLHKATKLPDPEAHDES